MFCFPLPFSWFIYIFHHFEDIFVFIFYLVGFIRFGLLPLHAKIAHHVVHQIEIRALNRLDFLTSLIALHSSPPLFCSLPSLFLFWKPPLIRSIKFNTDYMSPSLLQTNWQVLRIISTTLTITSSSSITLSLLHQSLTQNYISHNQ